MKSKRRHELQTNTLADWTGKQIESVKPYTTWIVAGAILVVLAMVVLSIRSSRQTTELTDGADRLAEASSDGFAAVTSNDPLQVEDALRQLGRVAADYTSTPLAVQAHLAMADIHLRSGQSQMQTNKSAARGHFEKAAEQFEIVIGTTDQSLLKNRATFCLAKCYEWLFKFNKAQQHYAQVGHPYLAEAQMRLDDLKRKSTVEFYDKYAQWTPPPPTDPGAAQDRYPEGGFELDDDRPPPDAAIDYKKYLDATAAGSDVSDGQGEGS